MSELTPCNYCDLKSIKARAKRDGKKVKTGPSKTLPGWTVVKVGGEAVAWFMKLTDHCVC